MNTTIPQNSNEFTFDTQLRTLAAQATTRYPDEQARIDKALVIALNQGVTFLPDGTANVQSQTDAEVAYHVGQGVCDCPDATRAPLFCKHKMAVCLVRKALKLAPPQTYTRIAYHATFKGEHGMAIRDEAGRVWFLGDTDALVELFDRDRANLQLHGRLDLEAEAHRADLFAGTDLTRLETARLSA